MKGPAKNSSRETWKSVLLNAVESELVNSGDGTVSEKELLAADSMDQGDISLPMICEDAGKPTSSPRTGLVEIHLQEVADNPELKKYEKTNAFVELVSLSLLKIFVRIKKPGFQKDLKEWLNNSSSMMERESMNNSFRGPARWPSGCSSPGFCGFGSWAQTWHRLSGHA